MHTRFRLIHLGFAILVPLALTACQVTPTADPGPALPPNGSMEMDFAALTSGAPPAKPDDAGGDKTNFNQAGLRVGLLNLAINGALLAPRIVFWAALNTKPVFADGKWVWQYTTKNGTDVFQAKLSGWFEGNKQDGTFLDLEMKVTCSGCKVPTQDFVWYTGRFNTKGTDGYWLFFDPQIAIADKTGVRIAYDILDPTHRTLTFTNERKDGHEDAGDVVKYVRDGDLLSVTVDDASTALHYTAAVSIATGAGWIQVPGYNGGAKACWDGLHVNVGCSE